MSWPSQLLVLSYRLYTAYHKTKCRPIWLSVLHSVYRQLMAQLWKTHLQAFWHHSITIPSTTWAAYIGLHVKHHISRVHRQRDILLTQWRREGGGRRGMRPAALCRWRDLEGWRYGILKFGHFGRIGVCIAEWYYTPPNTPPVLGPHPLTVGAPQPHRKQCVHQETYSADLCDHSHAVKLWNQLEDLSPDILAGFKEPTSKGG